MVEDNPKMNELEDMVKFCKKHKSLYIYGHDITAMNISKYLAMSGVSFEGFIKPEIYEFDRLNEPFPIYSLPEVNSKHNKKEIGVIIPTANEIYNSVIDLLKMLGIVNFYIVSDWNKRTIVKKLAPRCVDDFYLEVNLADHCNLNCQCCDHFSPIASENFLDFDQYVKDIQRLASFTNGRIGLMKLQGGEPLLNDRLIDYMRITREVFPDSPICLFTDGLLLPKWGAEKEKNIWQAVKQYEIEVRMTQYPLQLKIEQIIEDAKSNDVPVTFDPPLAGKGARLWIFSEIGALDYKGIKHSVKHPFDLSGKIEKYRWVSCYQFNESIVLRDGKIYTCPMIPYAHYFNDYFGKNLKVEPDCYIDIYNANSFEEIAEFCTRRTSFCNYCAVHKRTVRNWKQSEHNIEEWVL